MAAKRNLFEAVMGAVVLLFALSFVVIAYKGGAASGNAQQYTLTAKFDRIDGLNVGSDVKISGIKVGSVLSSEIDPRTFLALVSFSIDERLKLPKDSSAEIIGESLLGGKYLAIIPGGDEEVLKAGEEVAFTQSSISLESLIGRFIFNQGEDSEEEGANTDEDIF